jgi:hypothetical protein
MQSSRDQLIDTLVATYRELNTRVRPRDEARLASATSQGSIRDIVMQMRTDELLFAQALKERISGVPAPDTSGSDAPVIGTESENDTTTVLISQFGTARATTLTMLKGLSDEDWNAPIDGGASIFDKVSELAANDQRQLQRIIQLLG